LKSCVGVLAVHDAHQNWIRIDRLAPPPTFVGTKPGDREVELRCIRRRVPGRAHVSDHVTTRDRHLFAKSRCIAVQMRVVVAVGSRPIELVNCEAARDADEELPNDAISDREDWRAARSHYVDRFVTMPVVNLVERIVQFRRLQSVERCSDIQRRSPGCCRETYRQCADPDTT
jgi:hypothetical protein